MSIGGSLVPFLMVVGGGSCFWIGAWRARRSRLARSWPEAQGEIITARVTERAVREGFRYGLEIRYRYAANGETYSSERIRFGSPDLDGSHSAAERAAERYHRGAAVRVRYNPGDPAESVLETAPGTDTNILLWGGAIFMLVGAVLFWKAIS